MNQLTSALFSQANEKICLEDEVKKGKAIAAELETRAIAAELEDAEKAGLLKVLGREIIKIDNMLTKFFPLSVEHAQATVAKLRKKRDLAVAAGASYEWDFEDYLVSIASRVKPLKSFGVDMLDASLRTFKALWLGEEVPEEIPALARRLHEGPSRLNEWRESAACVGADEALSFVLSWYDGSIKLDVLQNMRAGSPHLSDPDLVAKRKERAYSFIQYADVHKFVEGPISDAEAEMSDGEEEVEDEEVAVVSASTVPSSGNNDPPYLRSLLKKNFKIVRSPECRVQM